MTLGSLSLSLVRLNYEGRSNSLFSYQHFRRLVIQYNFRKKNLSLYATLPCVCVCMRVHGVSHTHTYTYTGPYPTYLREAADVTLMQYVCAIVLRELHHTYGVSCEILRGICIVKLFTLHTPVQVLNSINEQTV